VNRRLIRRILTASSALLALPAMLLPGCASSGQSWIAQMFGPPRVNMTEAHAPKPDGPTFDHSSFDKLLHRHVNEAGGVDYTALMAERQALQTYIERLATASFDEMGRNQKLALLINAYNAFTLELILENWHGGRLASIKDIPDAKRWNDPRWRVGEHTWSLNQIEHEQIRPNFREPRIHWALVCAAVSCPPLRSQAYVADRLDEQLADQAKRVHSHDRWYRYDRSSNTLRLTPLYNWYGGDFEQAAGSVPAYAARYDPELKAALEAGRNPRIQWQAYDWSLNSQENVK